MIKIAFVIDTIESPTAGTERQLLMLIKHLDRTKFTPYLFVLRSSKWLEKEFDLCQLFVAHINSFFHIRELIGVFKMSKFLKKERIDIIQTHFRDSSIAGTLSARIAGVKIIIGTRRNQGYWLTPLELKIQKYLDRRTSLYIANSHDTKMVVVQNEGITKDRIEVIYNGCELALFPTNGDVIKKRMRISLGIPQDTPIIVIVANLRPIKDHETFLKAAMNVLHDRPDSHFLIVGDGTELNKLKQLASELGIAQAVSFMGKRQDIPAILVACDIGVLSSLSESFSNAIIEYMAASLPVVVTNIGGAQEAIDDGINGYIVPIRDYEQLGRCIVDLLESGRMHEMGLINRRRSVERFSLEKMIQKSEQLYVSCLGGDA